MSHSNPDTIQVRKGEELDKQKVAQFIHKNFPQVPYSELEIKQFGAGASNLTYLLKIGDWEAVLRRPPLGPVAPKAHDMEREYRILNNLYRLYPSAPEPYIYSNDPSIVGSHFFIMERRKGIVLDTDFPESVTYTPELGRQISQIMVDQLVKLHQIDYTKTDLLSISRPKGFMERQVAGWTKRYERSKTDDISGVEELTKWLEKHAFTSEEPAIIHYDYKLNNAMFSEDFSEMVGLFDWEMTTVGDPLADLGAALGYWVEANDPEQLKKGFGELPITVRDGFFTREEFMEEYARKSGRDLSNIHFYLTFAYFKLAVIGQQIYYRYKRGQTKDARFANLNQLVETLIHHALHCSKGY